MRRAAIVLIAVVMCAGYSFGQSNGLPQWKVVKEFHVNNGVGPVGPLNIFTPKQNGFYRISCYMSITTAIQQDGGFFTFVLWTDQSGQPGGYIGCQATGDGRYTGAYINVFSPKPTLPVTLQIFLTDPPPQSATYNFAMTIEKLTQ